MFCKLPNRVGLADMSLKVLGVVLVISLLAGCGFKGPLELPDNKDKQEQLE